MSTGITRKIDALGRIVIPKEIRERFNIKENDYLEFVLFQDGFSIRKYSKIGKLQSLAQELTDTLNMFLKAEVFIADRDRILAYTGNYKDKYINKNISTYLIKAIHRREALFETYEKELPITNQDTVTCSYIDETIVANSEEAGIICLFKENSKVDEQDLKVIKIVTNFLVKYLEQ